ncbi:MAG: DUF2203 domain-containing protein [Planctomycetota bacterium]
MRERLFTLGEANRLLPLVRSITRDVVEHYGAVKAEIGALSELRARRRAGEPVDSALRAQDRRIERRLEGLRRLVDELESLGARLRDYERGVVDFPAAAFDGRHFTFYCWMLGEGAVDHWHLEAEGFGERRPVPAGSSA